MNHITSFKVIFWDFDGVIKDSVNIKTQAYFKLFEGFGSALAERVCDHHIAHGGISRFDKLPLYLTWADVDPNPTTVSEYCEHFSQMVMQDVIDAPWVAGVERYLRNNFYQQSFVVVSATPQIELKHILIALNLTNCFNEVYGAPTRKQDAIRQTLSSHDLDARDCLVIGDSQADLDAAVANRVPFLLRRHSSNTQVSVAYTGKSVEDFTTL